ncbi:Zn-dependent hydrolase [Vreelandella olivaria]|uniref:Zn-dependent hydrolase n=1 Tax=Vreelandella olivaria TaxID=390919 RepID=UPI00201EB847|nr:Zn-dependent hydrolase [Halomonas olivaria]
MNSIVPDMQLSKRLFTELAAPYEHQTGITRDAYGPGEQRAHELFVASAKALGLEIHQDAASNHFALCRGLDDTLPAWLVGSHLDSVPQGGNYDGAAGVVAGLAAIAGLLAAGITPQRDIIVAAFRAEESTWFPTSYLGSRSALGQLQAEELTVPRADSGRPLSDHMRDCGGDPDAVAAGHSWLGQRALCGMLELHIEQGSTLEIENLPIAIVTSIAGSFRYRQARCFGEWGHSGAVAKEHRHDALMAFCELTLALEREWSTLETEGQRATVTIGQIATPPAQHAFSKIPGEVGFCLDVRSESPEILTYLEQFLFGNAERIERERGVRFDLGPRTASTPAPMSTVLTDRCQMLASGLDIPHRLLPSGAGHDAATFSKAGIPTQLLFVRNQNGSHNPNEAMQLKDFAEGVRLLAALIQE